MKVETDPAAGSRIGAVRGERHMIQCKRGEKMHFDVAGHLFMKTMCKLLETANWGFLSYWHLFKNTDVN